ncbi:MAG TPA: mandelate racemase/muconate lactonizing enzyme family protein [Candidatus Limnocylindria bacterium]|nr:mandelate racemase/muconate lactonizing enzyme family protein [Candidatus Limnocylindria bacterium]
MTRVTRLSTIPISVPLDPPRGGSGHPLGPTFLTHCIVKAETDAGITGYGEVSDAWGCEYATVADAIVTEALARFVIGQDPRQPDPIVARARAWLRRRQGLVWLVSHALSGVEMALWDIAGKLADRPAYELLGGGGAPLPVYAGGNFLSQGSADVHREHFAPFLAKGTRAAKVRLGAQWQDELETLARLHELFGPKIAIFIDGNEAFTPKTAARIAPRLAECGVGFFEEPCPRDDAVSLARLVASSPVPIAYGEHVFGVSGFLELAEDRVADVWQPDAAVCGGMSELRRIAALAAARNVRLSPHSAGTPIGLAANLHAATGAPTLTWLEMSARMDDLVGAFVGGDSVSTKMIVDGTLRPPEAPGIGVEPAPDLAERYPYQPPPPLGNAPALYQGSV